MIPDMKLSARVPIGANNMLEVEINGDSITLHPDKPTIIHLHRTSCETEFPLLSSKQVFHFDPVIAG